MKFITTKLMVLLAALIVVVGCKSEDTYYSVDGDLGSGSSNYYGFLSLSGLNVSLVEINEEFEDSSDAGAGQTISVATRADGDTILTDDADSSTSYRTLGDSELKSCWLTISSINLKEPVSYEMSYEDFYKESAGEGVAGYELLVGQYDIMVDDTKPDDALTSSKSVVVASEPGNLGAPCYRGYGEFQIKSNETTEISDEDAIKCDLNNVKATVELSADLKAMFKPTAELDTAAGDIPLNVAITMGYMTYIFDGTEADDTAVYFNLASIGKTSENDESDTIEIVLSGMYNTASGDEAASYSKIESWKQTISGVTAGQSRKIGISIEHTSEGNVEFVITVENWVYNTKIDIDIMTAYANSLLVTEESVVDPESLPRIQLMDSDDDNTRFVAMEGDVAAIEYQFTPRDEATIASISATTPNLLSGAEMTWSTTDGDLGEFASYFEASVNDVSRKLVLKATDEGMTSFLASDATYVTTFTVVDSKGRESIGECTVNVGEATAPTVVWRDKDIYTRQEVTAEGLDFIIDITSSTTLTQFSIEIVSDVLTPEELASAGLNANMDLVNPDSSYAGGLAALGFPTGSDIVGKTDVVFDASSFMGALYGIGEGDSDFILTITNSAGKTAVATAGVYVGTTENPEFERPTGLSINWVGSDFDTRYDIDINTTLSVVIEIEAVNGIKSLSVGINSAILTEEELSGSNLSSNMDLVNPASEEMEANLKALGFPTGDDVEGE